LNSLNDTEGDEVDQVTRVHSILFV